MKGHAAVVAEARAWLGVPYTHQGRTRHGVDCIGLVIAVTHALGLSDYDIDGYSRVPSGRMMGRVMAGLMKPVDWAEVRPGDVLHLAYHDQPQHVVLVTRVDPMYILHADSRVGKVVEHRLDTAWRAKVRGQYRLPWVV